jgi:hypothetical protein
MEDHLQYLRRISRTSEFRGLEDIEKGVKLVREYGVRPTDAARAMQMDRSRIRRAVKAVDEGRKIGANGKPAILTPNEEAQLASIVKENIKKKTPLKYKEFKEAVCHPLPFLSHRFAKYLSTQRSKYFFSIFP